MSGKIVGLVFDHYPGAATELLLAVKLADNAHDDGSHIFPAVATLAELTRKSERTIQYQLRRMQAMGWLLKVREARGGGRGGGAGWPVEYRIDPMWIKAHDSRIPEADRPTWTPRPVPVRKEMGAISAPISSGKWVQPSVEMGAIAIAEMGATAIAPEPSLTVIEPIPPSPPPGAARVEQTETPDTPGPSFDAIAAEYPRRAGMNRARGVWAELAPSPQLVADMLLAIAAWKRSAEWAREEGRYIPSLAKWLTEKRWLDAPGQAAPPPPPPPLPPRVELTPEKLAANAARAREAAALARRVLTGAGRGAGAVESIAYSAWER